MSYLTKLTDIGHFNFNDESLKSFTRHGYRTLKRQGDKGEAKEICLPEAPSMYLTALPIALLA